MALTLKINTVDKTSEIDWSSLEKQDVLTKEPDRLEFKMKNYGSKTYRPTHGDDVTLFEGATKIFGGVVVETTEENIGFVKYYSVLCKDYQQLMDRKLVNKTYTSMTIQAIIIDIVTNYIEAGFTTTNVLATDLIQKIVFNDEQPSKCFQRLADQIGDCDWYVDYNKDVHFFKEGVELAPFGIDDTSGNYIFGSLSIGRNINQIRNTIIVRGGDKESSLLTETKIADGQQKTFVAKPNLHNLTVEKSTNSGSSWSTLTIGQDGLIDPTTKDVLYNPNNGFVIFRDDNKPASGNYIRWSGNQVYPIKIIRRDWTSISQYGEYQYIIRDATIKSETQATQRAYAEIKKYAHRANEGVFRTTKSGLRSGQSITINSSALGISETFQIVRVITKALTPTSFENEVHLLASEDVGVIDVLGKLLVGDPASQFTTEENEVLVQVEGFLEDMEIVEGSYNVTKYPRAIPSYTEAMSLGENNRVNPFGLNVGFVWVAGPYFPASPSDRNRTLWTDHACVIN